MRAFCLKSAQLQGLVHQVRSFRAVVGSSRWGLHGGYDTHLGGLVQHWRTGYTSQTVVQSPPNVLSVYISSCNTKNTYCSALNILYGPRFH